MVPEGSDGPRETIRPWLEVGMVSRGPDAADERRCSAVTACFYPTPVPRDAKPLAGVAELGEQQAALVLPEATQPAAFRDVQAIHDLRRPHLSDAG